MQSPLSSNAKVARRHIEERVRRLERHPSPYPDVLIVHGLGPISGREVRRRLAGDFEGVAGAERYFERCRIFAQEDLRISVRDLRWKIDGELGLGGQFRLDLYVPDARDVILDGLRSSPLWNVFWMTEDGQVVNVLDFLDAEVRRGPLKDA
jgi:hypothetical protein